MKIYYSFTIVVLYLFVILSTLTIDARKVVVQDLNSQNDINNHQNYKSLLSRKVLKLKQPSLKNKDLTDRQKQYIQDRDGFVDRLLATLSLKEKIGQMTQIDVDILLEPDSLSINTNYLNQISSQYFVGSFLNSPTANGVIDGNIHYVNPSDWINILTTIQNITLANSPSKVPMIYGMDSVHGANYVHGATMFPHNTGLAATFNPDLAKTANQISAKDSAAVGFRWIFSPVLGVAMQPLWSRTYETFGEDPYLGSQIGGVGSVQGLQGGIYPLYENVTMPYVVSTLKHYMGYSNPVNGKDRTPAWIPERMLRRYFLPSFYEAIMSGAGSVMLNSGEVNGVPMHASEKYVEDILRGDFGFDGVIVTDWQDIEKLVEFHHLTDSMEEAIIYALNAGVDMSMVPDDFSFPTILYQLVTDNIVPESRIDESVRRILNLKYSVGLFDTPFPDPNNQYLATIGSENDRQTAESIIAESITLLQNNNNALPLNPSLIKNILVTGPSSNSIANQCGGWSVHWQGVAADWEVPNGVTVLQGIQNYFNNTPTNVVFKQGNIYGVANDTLYTEAYLASLEADAVVVVMGELPEAETPGDINDLAMDPASVELLTLMVQNAKGPVILVLMEARPRVLPPSLISLVDAVIMAYLPGPQAGNPLAGILFGDINPSGRLSITYPATTGDISPYYYKYSMYGFHNPLFSFGDGLSYTTFSYSNVQCNGTAVSGQNSYNATLGEYISVQVTVENTGKVAGKEAVLFYLSDLYASVTPEMKMLKRFQKIQLNPGDSVVVQVVLSPYDFSFIGQDNEITVEQGQFVVAVGNQQLNLYLN
ncbi:hypothetical protein PPL_11388 [Heterostelium album PN500]|uniref:beta-glucosidase n=1 Tax=Heterostelium pallidum (strain ATCC 26659 / Pp 5 / PN500) TaxID=670386 RepID=D3BT95_HETP5|nr:hypothetical protein PPL_11388 [Heterostelium album PN500]EFA75312.1 hypothetical protein PPL_11388 [Heterostelium album PN500]|eukprot:XP_020427446.1 hypothetical protein PPL_11388 [Heterostelium album PN500]